MMASWQEHAFHAAPGTHLTNDISIEFEIQWKYVKLLTIKYPADHNILHTSQQ